MSSVASLRRPVCLFIPSFGDGGVERMMVNIARGIAGEGVPVDFLVGSRDRPFLDLLPGGVSLEAVGAGSRRQRLRYLVEYLERRQPSVVLSAKTRDDEVALAAKRGVNGDTRFFLRPGTAMSERWRAKGQNPLRQWLEGMRLRRLFRRADGVIAVSRGVADDVADITGIPEDRIRVIRNPNITPELEEMARAPLDHPWFGPGEPPVVMGMGGLRTQKDFTTLIRAFARLRQVLACRLLILGQGRQRDRLLRLADDLGLAEVVSLPGFDPNPYRYLARSKLFVLSSRWEGSPNVLTEALALGVPVVATDCRSGPAEITAGGKLGPLVPVGDVAAMAQAMEQTLRNPLLADVLRAGVDEYRMEKSARRYLLAFGLLDEGERPQS
ncbi:MAG: glycosyltransferase [Chromatiaceae bacterium]|nr:glycosyltransferase [Chromatiaceae bacterium]